jgi:hypothetical protein
MRWAGWPIITLAIVACGGGSHEDAGGGGTGATDPDAGAGPSPADCQGLMPGAIGAAFAFDVLAPDSGNQCDAATVDGQGVVAAVARASGSTRWYEFAPSYAARSGAFDTPGDAFAQTKGFIGLWGTSPVNVALFSAYGELLNLSPTGNGAVALGPAAVSGVVSFAAGSGSLTVRKHDAGAAEIASATIAGSFTPLSGAEDASGAVLALLGAGGTVSAAWVDLGKGTAGQPFAVASGSTARARPLVGGGIAVQIDGRWVGVLEPGESTLRSAPRWLGDAGDFFVARGGKAYAVVPSSGNTLSVVSSQGSACGTVAFPGVSAVSVGIDGTVVGASGTTGCTKFVWRNALH